MILPFCIPLGALEPVSAFGFVGRVASGTRLVETARAVTDTWKLKSDLEVMSPLSEKDSAAHSSVLLLRRIPGTGEPGWAAVYGVAYRRHGWRDLAAAAASSPQMGMPAIPQLYLLRHSLQSRRGFQREGFGGTSANITNQTGPLETLLLFPVNCSPVQTLTFPPQQQTGLPEPFRDWTPGPASCDAF